MVSVFGHWVEHFWEASVFQCAQEGLRYFTKGQQAFCAQLSYQWQLICLVASCSANENTGLLIAPTIQCFKFISTTNLRLTGELILKAIAKINVDYCDLIVVVLHPSHVLFGSFCSQLNKCVIFCYRSWLWRVYLCWPQLKSLWIKADLPKHSKIWNILFHKKKRLNTFSTVLSLFISHCSSNMLLNWCLHNFLFLCPHFTSVLWIHFPLSYQMINLRHKDLFLTKTLIRNTKNFGNLLCFCTFNWITTSLLKWKLSGLLCSFETIKREVALSLHRV